MARLTEHQLIAELEHLKELVIARDSAGGHIDYEWTEEPGVYEVTGAIRTGSSQGQGGYIVYEARVEPEQ